MPIKEATRYIGFASPTTGERVLREAGIFPQKLGKRRVVYSRMQIDRWLETMAESGDKINIAAEMAKYES